MPQRVLWAGGRRQREWSDASTLCARFGALKQRRDAGVFGGTLIEVIHITHTIHIIDHLQPRSVESN